MSGLRQRRTAAPRPMPERMNGGDFTVERDVERILRAGHPHPAHNLPLDLGEDLGEQGRALKMRERGGQVLLE